MNRPSNFIVRLTGCVLAAVVLTQLVASTDVYGCQLVPQPSFEPDSSRRADSDPPIPAELEQEAAEEGGLNLDSVEDESDRMDSSESLLGPEEDTGDDEPEATDAEEDEDYDDLLDDEADDEADDDADDEEATPQTVPTLINTDTRSLRVNIAETSGTAPDDKSSELLAQSLTQDRTLPSQKYFAWAAPDIRYQPLYFENAPHERYGQTPEGCELRQTVLSAAHFFGSAALLPYKLLHKCPQSCDGPLGFCRPGSETPFVQQHPFAF